MSTSTASNFSISLISKYMMCVYSCFSMLNSIQNPLPLVSGRASGSSMNNLILTLKPTLKPTSKTTSKTTSNYESIDEFGRWLFESPAASLEAGGRAPGLSFNLVAITAAKIEKMRITWPRGALERSRYAQSTRVCDETFDNLPRGHRGDRPCND